jgi:hypothetical protein
VTDKDVSRSAERVVHGPDSAVVLPKGTQEVRWRDVDRNVEHRAIEVGPHAVCACGWTGSGWTEHFVRATAKPQR